MTPPPSAFKALVLIGLTPCLLNDGDYPGGYSRENILALMETMEVNHLGWVESLSETIMIRPERPELAEQWRSSVHRVDRKILREFARITFLSDSREILSEVSLPTLVLHCRYDDNDVTRQSETSTCRSTTLPMTPSVA
jgi:sigma-B regulation protein RsbQ